MAGLRRLALLASLVSSSVLAAESGVFEPTAETRESRRRLGSPIEDKNLKLDEYLAKVRDWTPRRNDGELPIGLTEEEKEVMKTASLPVVRASDTPPTNPSFVPEYANMRGVLIRYPFGLTTELIKAMSDSATIYCLVASNQKSSAEAALSGTGVDPSTVEWIEGPTDSYWTRDYGPWFVYTDDPSAVGGIAIVNHVYNRPRFNDNEAPLKVANHIGVPWFDAGIVGSGGNMMVDGLGQAAASHIAYTENDSCGTSDETSVPLQACGTIDTAMLDYFGVGIFHVVADPNNEYIDHIDCWAKYLSNTTVLMREVSTSHPQYYEIEEVATYLRDVATTSDGGPWNMVRIWTDSDQPYTNSLILNDQVFVPIVGSAFDDDALQKYQDSMPGYTVTGWTGTWASTDALHCRVRGIPEALNDCGNGHCDASETCESCPTDCVSTSEGAVCGNGICEGGNGENCVSCPGDCRGKQGGKPANRYCCGDADGQYAVPCSDSRCIDNGASCTDDPVSAVTTCCGDDICEGDETFTTCARDCKCGDGTCDAAAGEDFVNCPYDCSAPSPPPCQPIGESCSDKSECCSNRCDNRGPNPSFQCVAKRG